LSSKSTFLNSTSKSYALALYELAKENSELNKVEDGMDGIKTLLNKSYDFKEMILNPTVTKEEKNKVIIGIVNQYSFCQTLKKFLSFLLYLLPIALISSTFLSDFLISLASILLIFLVIKKNEWFYFNNKLFFFLFYGLYI